MTTGQHVLVAVSGGPDSTALLSLVAALATSWNLKLTAVHFNYGLRGAESEGDEAFVSELCRAQGISLIVQHHTLKKRPGASSLQELAREFRYDALARLRVEYGADRILTAHTANDQAETVLLWLLRGSGLTGLAGMPFSRDGFIIRPMLAVTRQHVMEYLARNRLTYRRDSSNKSDRYRRNRVRSEVLPLMEKIVPAVVPLLQRQAALLREDEAYLEQVVRRLYGSFVSIDAAGRQRLRRRECAALPIAIQRRLIRLMLRKVEAKGLASSFRVVEAVRRFCLTRKQGAITALRDGHVSCDREYLWLSKGPAGSGSSRTTKVNSHEAVAVSIPSTVYWPGTDQEIHVQVLPRETALPLLKTRPGHLAVFDADRMSEPLMLRGWRNGDCFHPIGMGGKRKKVQDLFTDMKIARPERSAIPLLTAPEGILWVVGRREDERFRVHDGTSRCLVVTVSAGTAQEGVR
ncbi:tRNA(Ile)-lysidine synthase [Nitrospira sp. KM1]|uniref:tRNA lysidine(34) synthetase TilS n=1 Tax=Nitrospira sp. KM1 TaxID=1936990 RepID=UPI0013A768F1|nr:tRNA lysidine(34) synthetase TilS [Nitrospira sp. KM1]BCA53669.1 tRNA(Ile)-lysidine synthase [Nitrospira sp. KM1]